MKLAIAATHAQREAEKFVGAPAAELVRLPKAGDVNGMKAVWQRLGAPNDATGYDLSAVKFEDGTALDDTFSEQFRTTALGLGLTKEAAAGMAQFMARFMDGAEKSEAAETTAQLTRERSTLQQNWGQNYDANKFIASQAASRLGVKPEEVAALENVVGYARVMEMFRDIGTKIGEANFISGNGPQGNLGVMSADQARARLTELKNDPAWVKAYLAGDADKGREMMALNTVIAGASRRVA